MKCLEIPAPKWRRQYSSKLPGPDADAACDAPALATRASMTPSRHSLITSGGSPCRLAWYG